MNGIDTYLAGCCRLLKAKAGDPVLTAEIWQRINYALDKRNELTMSAAWDKITSSY